MQINLSEKLGLNLLDFIRLHSETFRLVFNKAIKEFDPYELEDRLYSMFCLQLHIKKTRQDVDFTLINN